MRAGSARHDAGLEGKAGLIGWTRGRWNCDLGGELGIAQLPAQEGRPCIAILNALCPREAGIEPFKRVTWHPDSDRSFDQGGAVAGRRDCVAVIARELAAQRRLTTVDREGLAAVLCRIHIRIARLGAGSNGVGRPLGGRAQGTRRQGLADGSVRAARVPEIAPDMQVPRAQTFPAWHRPTRLLR